MPVPALPVSPLAPAAVGPAIAAVPLDAAAFGALVIALQPEVSPAGAAQAGDVSGAVGVVRRSGPLARPGDEPSTDDAVIGLADPVVVPVPTVVAALAHAKPGPVVGVAAPAPPANASAEAAKAPAVFDGSLAPPVPTVRAGVPVDRGGTTAPEAAPVGPLAEQPVTSAASTPDAATPAAPSRTPTPSPGFPVPASVHAAEARGYGAVLRATAATTGINPPEPAPGPEPATPTASAAPSRPLAPEPGSPVTPEPFTAKAIPEAPPIAAVEATRPASVSAHPPRPARAAGTETREAARVAASDAPAAVRSPVPGEAPDPVTVARPAATPVPAMTTAPSARAEADGARAAEADPIAATTAAPERASEPSRPFRPTAPRSGPAPANDSIERIAVAIKIAARHGMDRIQIKLQPEHLGSVEITLDVRDGNRVQATVASDRSATHELLQRDARGLERALEQAGLKVTTGDLTFAWRQGGQSSHGYGHEAPAFLERPDAVASETEPDPALVARAASWRDPARLIDLDA